MVTLGPASIVVVPFPFSDLSGSKLRPAIVVASTGHSDWLMCQVTSNPYIDPTAIRLDEDAFRQGTLATTSYAQPMKLFTANSDLIVKRVAILEDNVYQTVVQSIITALEQNLHIRPNS